MSTTANRPRANKRTQAATMPELIAIDPGTYKSAYSLIDIETRRPIQHSIIDNEDMLALLDTVQYEHLVIEMVASYGMAVGAEVFETCVWIGRFIERPILPDWLKPVLVKRNPIKLHHCGSSKANDSNIKQALIDRFAKGEPNHGKGTKANPGFFYDFSKDIWQAFALAVYQADQMMGYEA